MILTYVFTKNIPERQFPFFRGVATKFAVDVDSPYEAIDEVKLIRLFATRYELSIHDVELDGIPFDACDGIASIH